MKSVLAADWTLAGAIVSVKPHEIVEALKAAESGMIPMKSRFGPVELKESAEGIALDIALRPIGAKLDPKMSAAQASAWRDAVMMSMMKWPAKVAIAAARAAIMESYQYGIGDVDAKLHELAAPIEARQRLALRRLHQMRGEIERAMNPQPVLEEAPHIWTAEEIEEANAAFHRVGSSIRYRLGEGGTCETNQEEVLPDVT
jgi:hypothetical protein